VRHVGIPGKLPAGCVCGGDLVVIGLGLGQFGIDLRLAAAEPAEQSQQLSIVARCHHAAIRAAD
jgi:hypothetical protein